MVIFEGHVQHHNDKYLQCRGPHRRSDIRSELQALVVRKKRIFATYKRVRRLGSCETVIRPGSCSTEKQAAWYPTKTSQRRHVALQEILRRRY
jgi:hypothetical protein